MNICCYVVKISSTNCPGNGIIHTLRPVPPFKIANHPSPFWPCLSYSILFSIAFKTPNIVYNCLTYYNNFSLSRLPTEKGSPYKGRLFACFVHRSQYLEQFPSQAHCTCSINIGWMNERLILGSLENLIKFWNFSSGMGRVGRLHSNYFLPRILDHLLGKQGWQAHTNGDVGASLGWFSSGGTDSV